MERSDEPTRRELMRLIRFVVAEMRRRKSGHVRFCWSWAQRGPVTVVQLTHMKEEPLRQQTEENGA